MPICEKRKLAFCHIPRTGGVSICNGLNLKVKDKHYPASYYRTHFPDYTLFATMRSYEDRVKSALGWRLPEARNGEADSFEALVNMIIRKGGENFGLMVKPNEYFLDCAVDFLLRFDHLEEDLNVMLTKLGHNPVKLTPCNSFRQ